MGFLISAALGLTALAGWITNAVLSFHQHELGDIALGAIGIFVPFVGAAHGIWTWF